MVDSKSNVLPDLFVATEKQDDGEWGEIQVCKKCSCPRCKKSKTFKRLIVNFKCVDVICDFCGYLAQVKTKNVKAYY